MDTPHLTERQRAHHLLDALRTMKALEASCATPTADERRALERFTGFGPIARNIFPDPVTHAVPMAWRPLAEELRELLDDKEYASARRSTFNAFYTSPLVMAAAYAALERFGVPQDARVLEPGCGVGNFLQAAPKAMRFTGVELEVLSGRIAKLLHPHADIRIEPFQDTPAGQPFDAVVGNVPFGDVAIRQNGHSFSLHDFFFAKALDLLASGGVMALVTSRYTMDKLNGAARDYLADRADLVGAIRLPDDAFKEQGTRVVTDIVMLRKRHPGEPEADPTWRRLADVEAQDKRDGPRPTPINAYFAAHPEHVLGDLTLEPGMHGGNTLRVHMRPGYAEQLRDVVTTMPAGIFSVTPREHQATHALDVAIPPGLGEGSFFVTPAGAIMQVVCGVALPVVYRSRPLSIHDKGDTGPRIGRLIGLRDDARAVLRAQNEGHAAEERDATRKALNRSYDRFVAKYGPVNKTTLSVLREGGDNEIEVRRMPNMVRFREDPDAVLVMSLEQYDQETGTATKAAIMRQDVVGTAKPVQAVTSAEEGLAVSLNERGRIDLDHIARLYGRTPDRIVAELGDLVFHDPDSDEYVTRDAYLSGNVRQKLAAAQASADPLHRRNVAALLDVQPEDLLPGDIDANLGAPWLPIDVIGTFAADLFDADTAAFTIRHLPKDALWTLEGDYRVQGSAANTSEFGTARVDGLNLLDQALNLRTPTVYDVHADGSRTLNQAETIAAIEKQKRIKQRFRDWVFSDPERAERLVRIYNDGFNNLRLREFDGSHLTFPGMSPTFTPRPHQAAAVWRIMTDGNTLLAHTVGAGKTACMAAACMKLRQTGLAQKPLVQIPNHMLEQFGREFLHIYPNARLLVASKDDLAKDRRKLLTAKIATGDWDAIIMTHSSFERVGMSPAFQSRFLQEQIDDYEDLLVDARLAEKEAGRGRRSMVKHIEKRKAAFEEKLKAIAAADKKDDGLVFDDLGVDWLFTDEFHMFKNVDTATKMDRVAGIQTGGSQRAFDLMMKARYLDKKTPRRGMVGATGTPISNSMVELFNLQRFLDPAGLRARGIDHFDAWAASFGEVVTLMEISPDGANLRATNRFANFLNLPELQQMFRSFADVQTADMLKLPTPPIKGGKPFVIARPMSDWQCEMQHKLVERYERIRRRGVDPREDNALAITTDGRKLALDARLLAPLATDHPDSKLNAAIDNIAAIWRETTPFRGAQLVFSDIGVNPTEWGFSVYEEIRRKLEAAGIPPKEIAFAGDADTDAKKAALFAKIRAGQVRVLIGSTAKMGAGTNVQERLATIHHIDAPWKPAEIEQRDGRGVRQGNTCAEIALYRYVTKGSFDAFMWQGLENKARFITQIMKGDLGLRRADDIGGQELTFAEVKAIASGNPAVLRLAEIEADLQRLSILKRLHHDDQYRVRSRLRALPEEIARLERRAGDLDADYATAQACVGQAAIGGRRFEKRADAVDALNEALKAEAERPMPETRDIPLGTYRGLTMTLSLYKGADPEMVVTGARSFGLPGRLPAGALFNRIDREVEGMPAEANVARDQRRVAVSQLATFEDRAGLEFDQALLLTRLIEIRAEIEGLLSGAQPDGAAERTDQLVAEYAALKNAPAAMPVKTEDPVIEQHREPALIIPFPEARKPLPMIAAREADAMPTRQGMLFDEPVKKVEADRTRWASKVEKRRQAPRQLSLF